MARWEAEGFEVLEVEALKRAPWPPVRREHVLGKLAKGIGTDEMAVYLLLAELRHREWMAAEGWEADAEATLGFYRQVLIARVRAKPTASERDALRALDELEWQRIEAEPAMTYKEIHCSLARIRDRAELRDVFEQLRRLHHWAQQSKEATVPRAMRDLVPKKRRLPYEPVGFRRMCERQARSFRRELGEDFINGAPDYQQVRLRGWRYQMRQRQPPPNGFAHDG